MNKKIMIVEDESIVAMHIESSLKKLGYTVCDIVSSGEEAIKKAEELRPDLILMDIMLRGEIDGIETMERIHTGLNIPVVYMTAFGDEDTLKKAKMTQPFGFILKPFKERELQIAIEISLYRYETEERLRQAEQLLSAILRSIGDAVIATDTECKITFLNAMAETLTGWKHKDALNRNLAEVLIIRDVSPEKLSESIKTVMREGMIINLISNGSILINRDGSKISVTDNIAPIKDQKGNIHGAVIVFHLQHHFRIISSPD